MAETSQKAIICQNKGISRQFRNGLRTSSRDVENGRVQILESNFLVLSNRYGRKCTRLRSLGSEKFAFALQSHIRTVEDIIQSAVAKRRMAIERLLAQ